MHGVAQAGQEDGLQHGPRIHAISYINLTKELTTGRNRSLALLAQQPHDKAVLIAILNGPLESWHCKGLRTLVTLNTLECISSYGVPGRKCGV